LSLVTISGGRFRQVRRVAKTLLELPNSQARVEGLRVYYKLNDIITPGGIGFTVESVQKSYAKYFRKKIAQGQVPVSPKEWVRLTRNRPQQELEDVLGPGFRKKTSKTTFSPPSKYEKFIKEQLGSDFVYHHRFSDPPEGVKIPSKEKFKKIVKAIDNQPAHLTPDFVNFNTGQIVDAKWYHTLKDRFGRNLSKSSWYSNPENQNRVLSAFAEQFVNYGELQKKILSSVPSKELGKFMRVPDPPIIFIFPKRQAQWLEDMIQNMPGAEIRYMQMPH